MLIPKQQVSQDVLLSLFISYAHEDEPLLRQLEGHLSLLRRQGLIADWHDRQILAGNEWAHDIEQHLEGASVILLLISPDFLASEYCYEIEMERALERHKRGVARIIPIILRPCDWQHSPFAHLQCLPRNTKPIVKWDNWDEALVSIVQELRKIISQHHVPHLLLSNVQRQNRTRLLKRVHTTWIKGLLEQSLHRAAWIELHLQEQPDALENPWQLQVQELEQEARPLPPSTSIVQVYDEANGELLILGEPGAGKTTLLLQLARTLLDRAEADERLPMPVVFNLSSWTQRKEPIVSWLVAELKAKYQIPHQIGQHWIEAEQILPLLDGLDEVAEEARIACVQAITEYHQNQQNQAMPSLVICCRSHEYQELELHLHLNQAISILPLTEQQVNTYLFHVGKEGDGLRYFLATEPEFAALARTPLILSIATLAFQRKRLINFPSENNFPSVSQKQILQVIFANYVERMFSRREQLQPRTKEQFLHWLIFIAKQMHRQQQTVFSVEDLQPDWLQIRQRHLYWWSIGLLFGLIGGLVGYLFGYLFKESVGVLVGEPIGWGLVGGLFVGLTFGLIFGLNEALFDGWIQPAEEVVWLWKKVLSEQDRWRFNLLLVPLFVIFGGLIGLLIARLIGLLIGGLIGGLVEGLMVVLFFILPSGIVRGQRIERDRFTPNEGIRRSGKNGLVAGLIAPVVVTLAMTLLAGGITWYWKGEWKWGALVILLPMEFFLGLIYGLQNGLYAFTQHFILRIFLRRANSLPWNVVPFLDEATERLFLRKVGGSYIFVHRLLLDYLAVLETRSPEKVSAGSASLQKLDEEELLF